MNDRHAGDWPHHCPQVQLLTDGSTFETYKAWTRHFFGDDEPCDMCGPRFQPSSHFPPGCRDAEGEWRLHARVDHCGVCGGANACLGCDGKRGLPPAPWDACGACNVATAGGPLCQGCDGPGEEHHPCGICLPPGWDPCSMPPAAKCNARGLLSVEVWSTVQRRAHPLSSPVMALGQQGNGAAGGARELGLHPRAAQRMAVGMHQKGTSEVAPEAVGQAVGGGCQSGWGRLLSVTNAVEAGTWRQRDSGWA